MVCVCLFNNLPALNLLSLPPLQGASRKASAVLFFLCFILEPSFLYSSFVSLDQCSTKDWSQVGLKYCEPVRPPLSADKSVSELGSAPQCTGLFFFFKSAQASVFHQALASPPYMWAGSTGQHCVGDLRCSCLCSVCNLGQPVIRGEFIHLPMAASPPSISC